MSEDDFTKSPRFQTILRDAIAYRVLCMSKDWQRYRHVRNGSAKIENNEPDGHLLDQLAAAH
jgi:hypothetical protein